MRAQGHMPCSALVPILHSALESTSATDKEVLNHNLKKVCSSWNFPSCKVKLPVAILRRSLKEDTAEQR